jgi:hypothetical protein
MALPLNLFCFIRGARREPRQEVGRPRKFLRLLEKTDEVV